MPLSLKISWRSSSTKCFALSVTIILNWGSKFNSLALWARQDITISALKGLMSHWRANETFIEDNVRLWLYVLLNYSGRTDKINRSEKTANFYTQNPSISNLVQIITIWLTFHLQIRFFFSKKYRSICYGIQRSKLLFLYI